jgi:hypothetical protein
VNAGFYVHAYCLAYAGMEQTIIASRIDDALKGFAGFVAVD